MGNDADSRMGDKFEFAWRKKMSEEAIKDTAIRNACIPESTKVLLYAIRRKEKRLSSIERALSRKDLKPTTRDELKKEQTNLLRVVKVMGELEEVKGVQYVIEAEINAEAKRRRDKYKGMRDHMRMWRDHVDALPNTYEPDLEDREPESFDSYELMVRNHRRYGDYSL